MRPAPPAAATAAEPQTQPVVSERIQPNPDHFGNGLLQCTTIGVCCIASNGICVGPSPHAIPRPDRTLPLSGLFLSPLKSGSDDFHALPRVGNLRAVVWEPTLRPCTSLFPWSPAMRRRLAAVGLRERRAPWMARTSPHGWVHGVSRKPTGASQTMDTHRPRLWLWLWLWLEGQSGRASGRTICTRLNSVLPGSSHGTMCAECSNHTACL